jgi:fatty-acyl-CoA synthase
MPRAISHVHGTSQTPLLRETIGACLTRHAASHGNATALVSCHQQLRYSYDDLHCEVGRAARGLLSLGVERGDRVGIWSANCAEWVVAQYASAAVGAILVNVNPAYRLRELEFALSQSGVSVLIMARRFRSTEYIPMLVELAPELATRRAGGVTSQRLPALRHVVYIGRDQEPGGISWIGLLERGDRVQTPQLREREREVGVHDAVNIQYTSGTTGSPKGATLSHSNILNNGFFVGEALRYTPGDRICVAVPFYHCFGCVMGNLAALTHASAVVIPDATFDAASTLRAIEQERCTSIYGVPTMFIAQLEHPDFDRRDLSSLRTGIMAGAPCPTEVMRQVIDRMHVHGITICYGMTETSPVSFQSGLDDSIERRVSTVGRIHDHVECKIIDPAGGETVARGVPGELCTRGYSVMLGYWNDDTATAAAIDTDGWMHSGDLAVMDADGYVNIVGRLKDMIIRGGENIYPREIEEFLYTHPAVAEVQVIGVPDVRYGEELCAWIRLRPGAAVADDDIREYCRGQIATCKIPRYIRFTTEFPTTVTGKIQKYRMRDISVRELGLTAADQIQTA